MHEQQQLSV